MRSLFITIAVAAAVGAPHAAWGDDPYASVNAMRQAFARVQSATATERFGTGEKATVLYNAPNRYRITTSRAQIVLAGQIEYSRYRGGSWMPSPHGAMHQQILQAVWQLAGPPGTDLHKLYTIASLGTRSIDGSVTHGYRLDDKAGGYTERIWVGSNELPVEAVLQMPGESIDIHYSAYNSSTLVATPNGS